MGIVLLSLTVLAGGAQYDPETHALLATGAAAADVRAPSASIARVKAERLARERAEKKLAAGLEEMHKKKDLLKTAQITREEYGSDGSVELTLTLATDELPLKTRHKKKPAPKP